MLFMSSAYGKTPLISAVLGNPLVFDSTDVLYRSVDDMLVPCVCSTGKKKKHHSTEKSRPHLELVASLPLKYI